MRCSVVLVITPCVKLVSSGMQRMQKSRPTAAGPGDAWRGRHGRVPHPHLRLEPEQEHAAHRQPRLAARLRLRHLHRLMRHSEHLLLQRLLLQEHLLLLGQLLRLLGLLLLLLG